MKPKIAKEVGRVIKYLNEEHFSKKYEVHFSDLHFAQFKVKIDHSDVWHDLVILTTPDFQKANSYVFNGIKYSNIEDNSWINGLLRATNTSPFDSKKLREFLLCEDGFQLSSQHDQRANLLLLICKTAAIITISASLVGLIVASVVLTAGLTVLGIALFSASATLGVMGLFKVKAVEEGLEQPVDCEPCFSW